MAGGPRVDRAAMLPAGLGWPVVLRHVRRDAGGAKRRHMSGRVIGLVLARGDAASGELACDGEHRLGRPPFCSAGGLAEHAGDGPSKTVLHGDVPHIAQPRLASRCLAIQPAVGIGGALMSVVLAGLTMEVRAIPVAAVLRTEAAL